MVQCLFLCLTDGLPIPLWLPCMMGAVGLMFALIAACCTISLASAGYFTACAFLTAEFAASLEWQLWSYTQHTLDLPQNTWSTAALSLVYLAAVYTTVFGGIRRLVSRREDPPSALAFRAEELWPPVVISAACFFMSNLSFVYSNTPFSSSVLESIYNIRTLMDLAGVAMLYAYFVQKPQYRKQFARKSEQFTRSLCQGPENVIGYALSTAGARPVPVTTVYDMESTPWWNNFGDFKYTNTQEFNGDTSSFDPAGASPSFVNYVEGIYVGYKFYETAAAEGLIDYDRTVQYPFGYGLSYTSFTQEMGPISERNGTITFDVTVTNTGSAAGKDVVAAVNQFAFAEGEITYLSRANGFANYARTAFAGRNFEYYAEDGMLSGAIASNAVAGAKEHGVYSYMKHFALNDQEGNRNSMLCTWSNEQAIRKGSDLMLVAYQTATNVGPGGRAVLSVQQPGHGVAVSADPIPARRLLPVRQCGVDVARGPHEPVRGQLHLQRAGLQRPGRRSGLLHRLPDRHLYRSVHQFPPPAEHHLPQSRSDSASDRGLFCGLGGGHSGGQLHQQHLGRRGGLAWRPRFPVQYPHHCPHRRRVYGDLLRHQ